jgi:hypothetical protein
VSFLDEISPNDLQQQVQRGQKRLSSFRAARMHCIKEYVGQYYDSTSSVIGTKALNLIFNAIRVLVPNLVMNFPKHTIETPYLAVRQYANLLGLALDQHDKKINIRDVYRRVIVDAFFTLGIMKTGLAQSDSVYVFDDQMGQQTVDNGTVYTEVVDFDDFVVDPASKQFMFKDATWMGDRITIPRQMLLDSGLYNNDLVERLPRAGDKTSNSRASDISMKNIEPEENYDLQDEVEVYEIWVPSANAIVTVPAAKEVKFDDYLRVADYYGVKEGPYTLLSFSPPVPGNPLPVPMVGIWYDLHVLANRMAKKIVEQAERQKDIVTYKRTSADDADSVKDAGDGEAVALDDPDGVKTISFGGQQNSNENHLNALEGWFNMMAGNPAQVGGQNIEAKSATAANILQANSGIGLEDAKDQIYIAAASEARKRAWYFHEDPLMNVPLTQRQMQPGGIQIGPSGVPWMSPPTMQEVQVILTPEQKSGNYIDFVFSIEPESMGRIDSKVRLQQEIQLCQVVLPAVMAAAQVGMALGMPLNVQALLIRIAKDMGISWMSEILYDPGFQQQMQQQMMMGMGAQGQNGPQKGQIAGQPQQPNGSLMGGMLQNGQPGQVAGTPPNQMQQQNSEAQQGAQESQRFIGRALNGALRPASSPGTPQLP